MIPHIGTVPDNGGTTYPKCGDKQSYSLPQGKGVSFFCRPVLFGRYVTIRKLRTDAKNLTICEVEVYSERRGNTSHINYIICLTNSHCLKSQGITLRSYNTNVH